MPRGRSGRERGLKADRDYIIPDETKGKNSYAGIMKSVRAEMNDLGIVTAAQPVDSDGSPVRPELPFNISELPPDMVLDLLSQYGAYLEYVDGMVAEFRVRHAVAERSKHNIRAQIRLKARGTAGDKTDTALTDPRYIEADRKEFEAMAKKEMAESALEGASRSFFVASRAITSQGQAIDRTNREQKVAPKRRGEYGLPDTKRKRKQT